MISSREFRSSQTPTSGSPFQLSKLSMLSIAALGLAGQKFSAVIDHRHQSTEPRKG